MTIKQLEAEVWAYCQTMANDPQARYDSRCEFYKAYGRGIGDSYGLGDSELAFMRWEMEGRLVANGGSPWWSAVNLRFIYYSQLAADALKQGIPTEQLPVPSALWSAYISSPDSTSWYRAHNGSIIAAYEEYRELCESEPRSEQSFVNIVLYRLLFAQAMIEGWDFEILGPVLANPRGDAVEIMTDMSVYYPPHYPMTKSEYSAMFGRVHNLEEFSAKFFDDVLIGSDFEELYEKCAEVDLAPYLNDFLTHTKPSYPSGRPVYLGRMSFLMRIIRRIWSYFFH